VKQVAALASVSEGTISFQIFGCGSHEASACPVGTVLRPVACSPRRTRV